MGAKTGLRKEGSIGAGGMEHSLGMIASSAVSRIPLLHNSSAESFYQAIVQESKYQWSKPRDKVRYLRPGLTLKISE